MMIFHWSALRRRLDRFRRAERGIAAIEFALILPVMLLLYIGMTQVTLALNVDRKVTVLSRTVADLVGRASTMSTAQMNDVVRAALTVLEPFDAADVTIVLSSAMVLKNDDGDLEAEVCWSFANANGTVRTVGQTVAVPPGYEAEGTSFILAEVSKAFTPVLTIDRIFSTITLSDVSAWPVRNAAQVIYNNQRCTPPAPPAT